MKPAHFPSEMRPLTAEDYKLIENLCKKYGKPSVMMALRYLPEPAHEPTRTSMSTLASHRSIDSILYTSSEGSGGLSRAGSVTGSIFSQPSTRTSVADASAPCTPDCAGQPSRDQPLRSFKSKQLLAAGEEYISAHSPLSVESPRPTVAPPSGNYCCPLCHESVLFARKADCKRHIFRHHCSNTVWKCDAENCTELFDSKKNYLLHAKKEHSIPKPQAEEHQLNLPPQQAYACGFETCKDKVFEAREGDTTSKLGDRYADHVSKHYDDGARPGQWQFSVQLRNLLLQSTLKEAWKSKMTKEKRNQLVWSRSSASHLKHWLEWRLWSDTQGILLAAIRLGSLNSDSPVQESQLLANDKPSFSNESKSFTGASETSCMTYDNQRVDGITMSHGLQNQFIRQEGNCSTAAWNGATALSYPPPPPQQSLLQPLPITRRFERPLLTQQNLAPIYGQFPSQNSVEKMSPAYNDTVVSLPYDDTGAAVEATKMLKAGLMSKINRSVPQRCPARQNLMQPRPVSIVMEDAPEPDLGYSAVPIPRLGCTGEAANDFVNWGNMPVHHVPFPGSDDGSTFI